MAEDDSTSELPEDNVLAQPDIQRLRQQKQDYFNSLTPPITDEERAKLDEYEGLILEASARFFERRRQQE
jgi:hypothetical protein